MRMEIGRACAIVQSCVRVFVLYVCARAWRRIADVPGAADGMQILCGAYAVAVGVIAHELVVACSIG